MHDTDTVKDALRHVDWSDQAQEFIAVQALKDRFQDDPKAAVKILRETTEPGNIPRLKTLLVGPCENRMLTVASLFYIARQNGWKPKQRTGEPHVGTFTGRKVHFLNPNTAEIHIDDIVQSLSMQCRYNGHTARFYSVAEHSVHVCKLVLERTDDRRQALCALLHDASEAYLCDIPRPIKPHLTNYEDIERRLQECIYAKYDAPLHSHVTGYIDKHIVGAEARQLFPEPPAWANDFDSIDVTVKCWEPVVAQSQFLHLFRSFTDA